MLWAPSQRNHGLKNFLLQLVSLSEKDLNNIAKAVKALDRKCGKPEENLAASRFPEDAGRSWHEDPKQRQLELRPHVGQQRAGEPQQTKDDDEFEDEVGAEDYDESWAIAQSRLDLELQQEREREEQLWQDREATKQEPLRRGWDF